MPAGTPWAVAASGTSVTCSIQGFLLTTFGYAFPFYYASLGIYAYIALKNNFLEENYAWIEKWIHIGAYLIPLSVAIAAAAKDWYQPSINICYLHISGGDETAKVVYTLDLLVIIELLTGTFIMFYTLHTFNQMQKEAEVAIGMKKIVEKARSRRLKGVALQTALYLLSFWFGYLPMIIQHCMYFVTREINYGFTITSSCIYAAQGIVVMAIYFSLQQQSRKDSIDILPGLTRERDTLTVSKIRANAAAPKTSKHRNSVNMFSFHVFDGTPDEDSPFAEYLLDDLEDSVLRGTVETIPEEDTKDHESILLASLLGPHTVQQGCGAK